MNLHWGTAIQHNINKPENRLPPPKLYFLGKYLTARIPSKIAPPSDTPVKARYAKGSELKNKK